jgi:hypothetical protein
VLGEGGGLIALPDINVLLALPPPRLMHMRLQGGRGDRELLVAEQKRLAGVLAWLPRFGFVDPQSPAGDGRVTQPTNGGFCLVRIGHRHEAKAPWTSGVTIGDQLDRFHLSVGLKELTQVVGGSGEGDVSYVDIHALFLLRVGHQRQHIQAVE